LMILLKHCFVADLLCGRVLISPLLISSNFSSSHASDVSPLTALFAWESAALFPSIPSWPAPLESSSLIVVICCLYPFFQWVLFG
jgi:hypothetical protein